MRAILLTNIERKKLVEEFLLEIKLNGFFSKKIVLNKGSKPSEINSEIERSDFVFILKSEFENTSLGYYFARSIEKSKPVLVFLYKHNDNFFSFFKKNKVLVSILDDTVKLSELVSKAVKKAVILRDKRFNFFIPADLLNYLESVAKANKTTKSSILRQLIIDYKNKHS
ncbi:MAG: hypothetical protein KatS3mg091_002 [Patescibacteria group bacterium]|nr:MAG: hypothetical protein KatS3mg090_0332 [Patescibacteria group bacterium]GIW63200.1 MAG: hypothetical protein KatS3mg091_002 [Patescibacteria group bacterium]